MAFQSGTEWSEKEIEQLREEYEEIEPGGTGALTVSDIAQKHRRSKRAVRNKAYELGITKLRYWSTEELQKLKEYYSENQKRDKMDLGQLADELGRAKSNVCRKARELGLTDNSRGFSDDWDSGKHKRYMGENWLREQYIEKRLKKKEIAEKCDVAERTIAKWLNKTGIREEKIAELGYAEKTKNSGRDTGTNKEIYQCPTCGEKIERWSSQVNGDKVFCSPSCKGTYYVKNEKSSVYSDSRGGKRSDLEDKYFRSRWEANYARYLNFVGEEWEYEPKEFEFEEIKRGTRFYTPDFYLPDRGQYVEIKGWFRDKDKIKLKRFKKFYPEKFKQLVLVIKNKYKGKQAKVARELGIKNIESYAEIEDKLSAMIPGWE